MDKSHSVQRHFFNFSCVGCTPLEGIQKLVAQWLKCTENNVDYMKKWCYCTDCSNIVLCAVSSVLYHKSLPWGPKLGRWIKYTSPNLLTYLYYLSVGHPKSLLMVWLIFCIHSCFFHALSLLHSLRFYDLNNMQWILQIMEVRVCKFLHPSHIMPLIA
jgi:hypothetical protein